MDFFLNIFFSIFLIDHLMNSSEFQIYSCFYESFNQELDENYIPVWYMLDEFGLSVGHSEKPNCRIVPFYYVDQNLAYTLTIFIEMVTRDFVDNKIWLKNADWRNILLHPWIPVDFTNQKIEHIDPSDDFFFVSSFSLYLLLNFFASFFNWHKIIEILEFFSLNDFCKFQEEHIVDIRYSTCGCKWLFIRYHSGRKCAYDNDQFIANLQGIKYERVGTIEEADIVWHQHFHNYKDLNEKNSRALINQFLCENLLTVKGLFAASLTRGLDMYITDHLPCIIRLMESGPKIACKYIHRPVLFRRPDNGNLVKFDLRYIVFLRSLRPLDILVYKNFWIRSALNKFSLQNLDDIYAHFTVFNYMDGDKVLNVNIIRRDVQVSFIEADFMPVCVRECFFYPDFADTVFRILFTNKYDEETGKS
ncbi:unnamed protein product [Dracunculus medinensis]|uniref:Tubulin--tyrosine ligase-like protein 12 SET-like domain-containing protein n=1 Tax=Dracunculus medinensis TaxID=318479 RepID=A0A0N4UJC2_DRAME|nr:unnamed protein product [Dracunculus medinensis]